VIRISCLLALLIAAPIATAQAPTWGSTSTSTPPSKKDLAQRVVTAQRAGIEGVAGSLVERSVAPLSQAAGRALAQMPADKRAAAAKAVEAEVRKYLDEAIPLLRERAVQLAPTVVGPMLEEKFTEEELQQLAAWLDSPLNRKYLQAAPEMQNVLVQKLVNDNRGLIEPKLRATEERVMSQLGIKPSAAASGPAVAGPGLTPPAAKPAQPAASKPARKP
jgi:hypothetical protein